MDSASAWTITVDSDNIAWLTFDLFAEKVNKLTATDLTLKMGALALELLGDEGLSAPGTDGNLMGSSPNGSRSAVSAHDKIAVARRLKSGSKL